MKKALSVLLAAVLLFVFAAPTVFASFAPPDDGLATTHAAQEVKIKEKITITPAHTCTATNDDGTFGTEKRDRNLLYWDTMEDTAVAVVGFKPNVKVDMNEYILWGIWDASNSTLGNDPMDIDGRAEGTVTVYWECVDCGHAEGYPVTVLPEDIEDPSGGDDLCILRVWWNDLKYTWDYNIHPFFKYVYYNTCGWIKSAWNMLVDAIKGLFD